MRIQFIVQTLLFLLISVSETQAHSLTDFYGRRLLFSKDGEPLITVGMMQKQKEVRVMSEGGLIVEVGDKGPSMTLPAKSELKVTWLSGKPVKTKKTLVLETLVQADRALLDETKHKWRQRGVEIAFKMIGGGVRCEGHTLG